jgi:tungstate transport system ATP-binding protein
MIGVLGVRDLAVVYRQQCVLSIAALEIREGAHLAVVGPNGAGKSTLLRVLAMLQPPARGSVLFRGNPAPRNARDLLALRRRFAVVLQGAPLCDTTVYRNVAIGLRFRGVRGPDADRRIRLWLDRFGIGHLAHRGARSLSGGEAQRTVLARAFVLDPEVLFLDEPFAALDAPTRDSLLNDLESILRDARTTVVTVTHDREEAARLADALVVLMSGAVRASGPKEEILRRPPNLETAELFGFTVLPTDGGLVAVPPGGLAPGEGPVSFTLAVERVVDLGYVRRARGRVGDVRIEVELPNGCPPPSPGARMSIAARRVVELSERVSALSDRAPAPSP